MQTFREYMTLSIGVVVLLIVVTNAQGFSTALSSAGDVYANQLKTLQGRA